MKSDRMGYKAPKTISDYDEGCMTADAAGMVYSLAGLHPDARPIDLLNAFLRAFNNKVAEDRDEEE